MRLSFGTPRHQRTLAFERECLTTESEGLLDPT